MAVVVKFADNVIKGFATAIALVISSFVSISILHDSEFTLMFALGASLVLGSSVVYSNPNGSSVVASPTAMAANATADKGKYELVATDENRSNA